MLPRILSRIAPRLPLSPSTIVAGTRTTLSRPPPISPPRNPFHHTSRSRIHHTRPLRQPQYRYRTFGSPGPSSSSSSFRSPLSYLIRWSQRPTFYYEAGGVSLLIGGFYVYNLEEVPVSHRRRFNILSAAAMAQIAAGQEQQVLQQYRGRVLPESDPRVRMTRRVLSRLIPNADMQSPRSEYEGHGDVDGYGGGFAADGAGGSSGAVGSVSTTEEQAKVGWDVHVIDSPEANAFVLPGGKVFVFTGILPVAGDEAGLAAVLGHEIAHNTANHAGERMSQGGLLLGAVVLLAAAVGVDPGLSRTLGDLIFQRPGSRRQESEADYIGLLMMARSCYDPAKAVGLWERMQRLEDGRGGAPPAFLSTHPSSEERRDKIGGWVERARREAEEAGCGVAGAMMPGFRERLTGGLRGGMAG